MKNETSNLEEFDAIIGYEWVKNSLNMILDVLSNHEKYENLGVVIPHGILIYGRPGIGKTTLSKAFIEKSKRKSYIIRKDKSDGEFINGMKSTFEEARKNAPAIILLDDVDKYSDANRNNSNTEEYVAIQSLIDEVKNDNVFVIATANDVDTLPLSLLRAGRFDNVFELDNPKLEEAIKIIKHYLKKKKVSKDIDAEKIAKMLDGRSCAELEKVVNEAGIYAGSQNKMQIEMDDLIKAALRVLYETSLDEKIYESVYEQSVAYHEAGHAIVSEYLEPNSISFISISGGNSNVKGMTIYNQNENYFHDLKFMENRVKCLLAGRAATEVVYGRVDVGTYSDLDRAFRIVGRIADEYCAYGFDTFRIYSESAEDAKEKHNYKKNFLINLYYQEAKRILIEKRSELDKLANKLMKKKILFSSDIEF